MRLAAQGQSPWNPGRFWERRFAPFSSLAVLRRIPLFSQTQESWLIVE
jgi:hypothetical protein